MHTLPTVNQGYDFQYHCVCRSGGYTDSDTGTTDPEGKSGGKKKTKKERKKTANLGPRIKVRNFWLAIGKVLRKICGGKLGYCIDNP